VSDAHQFSRRKVAIIFLILGPPFFGIVLCSCSSLFVSKQDPNVPWFLDGVSMALNPFMLLAEYAAGFAPSLASGYVYSSIDRSRSAFGFRLLAAALAGAVAYCLVVTMIVGFISGGQIGTDLSTIIGLSACAGAAASVFCALIVEGLYTDAPRGAPSA
jgi:hypothetical protein